METNKLSGIVVYTIHDNSTLRDALREALKLKMGADEIDDMVCQFQAFCESK